MTTHPMGAPPISLRAGTGGVISIQPQIPVRVRRPLAMWSPWTRAIQELDEIISDARAWGVANARVVAPAHPELGAIDLEVRESTVLAALTAERAALVRWRPFDLAESPTQVTIERLVIGNHDYLLTPIPLDVLLMPEGALVPMPVMAAQDFSTHLRNTSGEDREYLFTWFCDR